MTGVDGAWRLVPEETWSGPMNMALDEIAARTAGDGGPRTVRVYRWGPSTLSLGYSQPADSVDWAWCEREGVTVTRRPTGGGGIFHDYHGDISYSVTAPTDEFPTDLMDAYEELCEPLLDAFSRMGVDADFADEPAPELHRPACYLRALNPAHDVVAGGKKISGNAQYRQRDAVVQHGSLSYARTPVRHLDCFADPGVTGTEFRERVTSIRAEADVTREDAVDALETALADWSGATVGEWTDDELAAARDLAREKYHSEAWNRRADDPTA
ncbi:lipoate--protein ligase family protein [Halocalculus aciditolerans]|uniref:Lipoprotein lipase n=1 Tax=Halocalculus aciditolerans TaxID=1383812 RepID=A0A830FN96_9EURY|nr:biotin/lipoate A/B protein ligase family protein [Halocalculus aciditolerans]GGL63824.1 lipoprotein lipase [Halocalculus aciditolerans]